MADQQHLDLIGQGVEVWNQWRQENPDSKPDFREADFAGENLRGANLTLANLSEADLTSADLSSADLTGASLFRATLVDANLSGATLIKADLTATDLTASKLIDADLTAVKLVAANLTAATLIGAILIDGMLIKAELMKSNLTRANFTSANLSKANLTKAILHKADLTRANLFMSILSETDLSEAILSEAKLNNASFIKANLTGANLTGCSIYGISVWGVELEGTTQSSLIITPPDEPSITVDNLEVAQFIYLLLNNKRIRNVIDTLTSKVVLLLGRFTKERKKVLYAIRDELRNYGYLPVLFDFDPPHSRDLTETMSILARLSQFVIADLTAPHSIPHELATIIPELRNVPIQPILEASQREYPLFEAFGSYPWVLPILIYRDDSLNNLLGTLKENVIDQAENKALELAIQKTKRLEKRYI